MDDLAKRIINAQWERREDKKNRKPRKGIGPEIRQGLFLGLEHIWLDLPGRLLAATHTDKNKKRRGGPAARYIQAYCGTVGRYVRRMENKHPSLLALAAVLLRIEANKAGDIVREGLKLTGFRKFAVEIAKDILKHEQPQKSPLSKIDI
jgi:hypothetical protein